MTELQKEIIRRANAAFKSGKTLPLPFRFKQLNNFLRMIDENSDAIVEALQKDLRKPKTEGVLFEIESLRSCTNYYIRNLENLSKGSKLPKNLLTLDDSGMVQRDPYGVVLVLGAWNYPIELTLDPTVGAIAAGNCVIIKPSEISPHCSALIAKLIPKYLDTECFHVIEAELEETKLLLTNRFDYIFATGSILMGKAVMAAAAPHLTPVTLELGGKSPCYIDENSDLELSVKRILWGKLVNLGQTCIAPDYVLCSKKVEKVFLKLATKFLKDWYGANSSESADLGRIVNERNFLRLKNILDTTKGNIVLGGEVDIAQRWISPTVLNEVTPDDPIMNEEIFGPILPILTVDNAEEAIEFIVSREKPLALYIFTKNDKVVSKFLEKTSSGGVCVNDTLWHVATEGLPFGGVGNSGMGQYHGKYSYDTFTHQKAVLHRGFNKVAESLSSARYPPYTDKKIGILRPILRNIHHFQLNCGHIVSHVLVLGLGIALAFFFQYILK